MMKKIFITSLFLLGAFGASAASTPRKITAPVDDVFIPEGFDSNDNGQVVVSGHFPNLCYKAPSYEVKIQGKSIDVKVKALHYRDADTVCAEIIVPFIQVVDLGVLDRGEYKVTVNGKTPYEKKGEIKIAESTSNSIDDFVYANVEYIEKSYEGGRTIHLKGHNPSDCFQLEEVKFIPNGKDTLSVLPIMKQVSDFCPMKLVPFSYEVEVPKVLEKDLVLLHVRVMDGKSVNSLFPNYLSK